MLSAGLQHSGVSIDASSHTAKHHVSAAVLRFGETPLLFWEPDVGDGNASMRINLASNHVITALEIRGGRGFCVGVAHVMLGPVQETQRRTPMQENLQYGTVRYCLQQPLSMEQIRLNFPKASLTSRTVCLFRCMGLLASSHYAFAV